jgi:hypothetical protein
MKKIKYPGNQILNPQKPTKTHQKFHQHLEAIIGSKVLESETRKPV